MEAYLLRFDGPDGRGVSRECIWDCFCQIRGPQVVKQPGERVVEDVSEGPREAIERFLAGQAGRQTEVDLNGCRIVS